MENTLAAAAAALDAGYGIECDVQLSRDGRAMVFHDERLDRLTGIDASLAELDAAALNRVRLADGSAVPTLAALLAMVAGQVPLVIEIKGDDERLADAVLADVRDYEGPLALEGFEPAVVARCTAAAVPVGLVGPLRLGDSLAAVTRLPRCDFLSWSVDRLAAAVERHPNLPLTAWTVRTPEQHARAGALGAQIVFEGIRP